jgi:outer membrane protein assembly factor BamB
MHNTVYAFDADDPNAAAPLWSVSLGPPVPVSDLAGGHLHDIEREVGVVSTPVISPEWSALYVVATNKEGADRPRYVHRLHALNLVTGEEMFAGPREISVTGFDSRQQNQRAALLLANGKVYIAFGSYGDHMPWHGWVFACDIRTLNVVASFNTSPGRNGAGIWQAGQGPVADSDGNIYFMTGNGQPNGTQRNNSFIKLRGTDLTLMDSFTPCNNEHLDFCDWDLGSAGLLLVPNTRLLLGGGKQGIVYVLDKNNLGGFQASPCHDENDVPGADGQIIQRLRVSGNPRYFTAPFCGAPTVTHHIHGSPVYWEGPNGPHFYVWPENDYVQGFRLMGEQWSRALLSSSWYPEKCGDLTCMPGGVLAISASGSQPGSGILWASHTYRGDALHETRPGILHAFDASNLRELWNSRQSAGDDFGNFSKGAAPTIANGKVYMGTLSGLLVVYGLVTTPP